MVFKTDYCLMQVKSISECSKGNILQYFCPSLSYNVSLRSLFCLFLSGCLRQVLLYYTFQRVNNKGTDYIVRYACWFLSLLFYLHATKLGFPMLRPKNSSIDYIYTQQKVKEISENHGIEEEQEKL